MFFGAVAATLLGTTILAVWNWAVASHVHEWSTDPKNTYLFITKRLRPEVLRRDFPFGDDRIFKFYQPVYMALAVRLSRWCGSIIPATRILHFVFTFAYFLGWILLARRMGGSWLVVLLFFAALVPYVPVTGADGIGVGAPGTWWSRSMANAFVPWFGLLAHVHFQTGNMVLAGFLMIGVLTHLHPVVAAGLVPALSVLLAIDLFVIGRFPLAETLAGLVVLGSFGLVFARSYFRSSARPADGPLINWDRVNQLAFNRFRLWPYIIVPDNGSPPNIGLNRFLHVAIGGVYMAAILAVLFWPGQPAGLVHFALTLLNFAILVFLHIPPGEGMGVRLAVLAAFGVGESLALSGPYGVALALALLVLARLRWRRILMGCAIVATTAVMAAPMFHADSWRYMVTRSMSPFDWWLALTIPAVFAWYLLGCLVTMDLLPLRLHQPLKVIDWGRTAKIVQLPMYCYVLWFVQDVVQNLRPVPDGALSGLAIAALFLATVLVNPLKAYRRHLHPGDRELFDWAKGTAEDSLFHVVSSDVWFGFDFRANTVRAITGTWKDGGICHYSDVDKFFAWDARMRLSHDAISSGKVSLPMKHSRTLGADYLVIDRRVMFEKDTTDDVVYGNERWEVYPLADGPRRPAVVDHAEPVVL